MNIYLLKEIPFFSTFMYAENEHPLREKLQHYVAAFALFTYTQKYDVCYEMWKRAKSSSHIR
jgi:hypothetical protein